MWGTLRTRLHRLEGQTQPQALPVVIMYFMTEAARDQAPPHVTAVLFPGGAAARAPEAVRVTAPEPEPASAPLSTVRLRRFRNGWVKRQPQRPSD